MEISAVSAACPSEPEVCAGTGERLVRVVVCLVIAAIIRKIKAADFLHPRSGVAGRGAAFRMVVQGKAAFIGVISHTLRNFLNAF